jgi:hypothetical protein
VLSKVSIAPFLKPSIASIPDEQQQAYEELEDMLTEGMLSSVCGWAIKQEEMLLKQAEVKHMKALLRLHFQGRSATNWTFLAICLKQVRCTIMLLMLDHRYA